MHFFLKTSCHLPDMPARRQAFAYLGIKASTELLKWRPMPNKYGNNMVSRQLENKFIYFYEAAVLYLGHIHQAPQGKTKVEENTNWNWDLDFYLRCFFNFGHYLSL